MKNLMQQFNVWKLAILRVFLFAFVAGATAFATSMNGVEWSSLSTTQKTMVLMGVMVVQANVIIAFLDRTIDRVQQGKNPVPGATEFIVKPKG